MDQKRIVQYLGTLGKWNAVQKLLVVPVIGRQRIPIDNIERIHCRNLQLSSSSADLVSDREGDFSTEAALEIPAGMDPQPQAWLAVRRNG